MALPSQAGKVALITGATRGLGQVTALELARAGAHVVIVGRDPERARATQEEIEREVPGARVEALLADLSSMKSVRELAAAFLARHPRLHLLINNAGAIFAERSVTDEGFERTFALNHLSVFLLTTLLLDTLKASAPARVVTLSSSAHHFQTIDFDDLMGERRGFFYSVYGRSKLANVLFAKELARRLEGTGVTSNAVHPGVVSTGFGAGKGAFALGVNLVRPFMLSAVQGAATTLTVATAPELASVTGKYFAKSREATPSRAARDPAAAARLWEESERLLARAGG